MAGHADSQAMREEIVRKLTDWRWRIDNLYTITDKSGAVVPFVMNDAQADLFDRMHYLNVILKARQLGFSTFIAIFFLDACLFNKGISCGLVDVTLDDAKAKLAKIRLAYEHLPAWLKQVVPIVTSNTREIEFGNGSKVVAGVSHRGGTLQYLHVSEFGPICARFPERAREIVTGALNTLAAGQIVFIESTAEGEEGKFYEIVQEAQRLQRMRTELTPLDYKFFFYPWWREPGYAIEADGVVIDEASQRYFEKLQGHGIHLTPGQRAWYVKKAATQLGDMKREYPSTPEEAFETSVEGAILGDWIEAVEKRGDIGHFPALPGIPVHTFWDIGRHDATAVWFAQILVGQVRVVGYYEAAGTELPTHAKAIAELYQRNRWARGGEDVWPHDGRVTEWGSGRSRIEMGVEHGLKLRIAPALALQDGINAARATLAFCQFDAAACADGLRRLRTYRWQWVESRGAFDRSTPAKNGSQHGADAFRMLAVSWREIIPSFEEQPDPLAKALQPISVDEAINDALGALDA